MSNYQIYDENTAPRESQQTLKQAKATFGLIPNLTATMAESPALVNAYGTIMQILVLMQVMTKALAGSAALAHHSSFLHSLVNVLHTQFKLIYKESHDAKNHSFS